MAVIIPFKGIRFNLDRVGDLAAVITPPYDVIGPAEQELYYRRSPYNLIRLEYGKTGPEDNDSNNRYTRAAAALQAWLEEGVLLREEERLFYLFEQEFNYHHMLFRRTGIVAALKLEPYTNGVVIPHERTMAQPKFDRLQLLRHCRTNFSPIFGLFADQDGRLAEFSTPVRKTVPLSDFRADDGQRYRLWAVRGSSRQEALARLLAPLPVFIADGHHRYKTALRFARELNGNQALPPGSGYVLSVLTGLQDPGLLILPTHRLLHGLTAVQLEELPRIIAESFDTRVLGDLTKLEMRKFTALLEREGRSAPVIGLLLAGRAWLLTAKPGATGNNLDVITLQERILRPILQDTDPELYLTYTRDETEARQAVLSGAVQAAFILNPAPIERVTAHALQGEILPQKSTCFYPKLPSGLVLYHHTLSYSDR